jgi:arylsulfatase A-like enzyme
MSGDTAKLYPELANSPFGNELIEAFAERALQAEQLGMRDVTDLLSVSFSSNDYVGHRKGPDSPEVHEMAVRTDKVIGKLFGFLDKQVGMQNVLVIFTADHGVVPVPEVNQARRMPGGRMPQGVITDAVDKALTAKYGPGKWIVSRGEYSLYLNQQLLAEKHADPAEANRIAAQAIAPLPHVFRVYTRERLMNGDALEDQVGRRVLNGFYIRRGPDISVLLEPYWIFDKTGTGHGTTFSYDSHVPVIFMGPGVNAGRYTQAVAVNDIAPTVATMLDVEIPSGSVGRVLSEMIE